MLPRPSNKSRPEIQKLARKAIENSGGPNVARVWYKFTCGKCGQRCTCSEPNELPEREVCSLCGHITEINGAGFALEVRKDRFVDWGVPQDTLVIRKRYESDRGDA